MRASALLLILSAVSPINAAVVVTAGYNRPAPIDVGPGQIITFYIQGIGPSLKQPVYASSLPLPNALAGISANFVQGAFSAPIPLIFIRPIWPCASSTDSGCASPYVVIQAQIPFGFDYNDPTVTRGVPVPGAQVRFSENGSVVASIDAIPFSDQIHVLNACDDAQYNESFCTDVATHADGSLASDASKPREKWRSHRYLRCWTRAVGRFIPVWFRCGTALKCASPDFRFGRFRCPAKRAGHQSRFDEHACFRRHGRGLRLVFTRLMLQFRRFPSALRSAMLCLLALLRT